MREKEKMLIISEFIVFHHNFLLSCQEQVSSNPVPNKPLLSCVCRTSLLKTLWEKEKLLVTSNFSFSHSVFYPFGELFAIFIKCEIAVCKLFHFGRVLTVLLFGRGLTHYHTQARIQISFLGGGGSHRKRTRLII